MTKQTKQTKQETKTMQPIIKQLFLSIRKAQLQNILTAIDSQWEDQVMKVVNTKYISSTDEESDSVAVQFIYKEDGDLGTNTVYLACEDNEIFSSFVNLALPKYNAQDERQKILDGLRNILDVETWDIYTDDVSIGDAVQVELNGDEMNTNFVIGLDDNMMFRVELPPQDEDFDEKTFLYGSRSEAVQKILELCNMATN